MFNIHIFLLLVYSFWLFSGNKTGIDAAHLYKDYIDCQVWIEKEKKLRKDLNSIGSIQKWLDGKNEHTAIEKRLLERLTPKEKIQDDDDGGDGGLQVMLLLSFH